MRDQSAIFVDAGFLLAVGGTHVAGTSLRSAFTVNYRTLIEGIMACAKDYCGLDVLRVHWYDASRDALFSPEHKQIGLLPDVKVRLGRISYSGEQKGVDLKLGLDLVGIARNRAASVAFLVSGDDDLAEAVEAAQDLGMKVVLIGVEKPTHRLGVTAVAEHLALRVDNIITLPEELIEKCFTRSVAREPAPSPATVPSVTPMTAFPAAPGAEERPRPKPAPPVPGPALRPAAPRRPQSQLVYSSGASGSGYGAGGAIHEQALLETAEEVGKSVAANWYGSTTQRELSEVLADRPLLPPEIDRVLLRDCAQRIGEAGTDLQAVRRTLRQAFWEKLDQLTS
jgi:uncharacterized LabA/DUF88 family protein